MRTILVPLDGSALAESALATAGALAARDHARLLLVGVVDPRAFVHGGPAAAALMARRTSDAYAALEASLQASRARIAAERPTVSVEVVMVDGEPADSIARVATERADLVVMTTHGRGGVSRAWLGSVTDDLVRRLQGPVLVLHPAPEHHPLAADAPFRLVLIPLDASADGARVIESARRVAGVDGVRYHLLRVAPALHPLLRTIVNDAEADRDAREQRELAEGELRELEARLTADGLDVRSEVRLDLEPARAILACAAERGADLIAIATHGRGPARRFLLGSVADKVIRGARIPVLVQHLPAEESDAAARGSQERDARPTVAPADAEAPSARPSSARLDRIVVAVDFAPSSSAAARWTTRCLAPDAEVVLAHAVAIPAPPPFLGYSVNRREQLLENARRGAELRMRETADALATPRIRTEIRAGRPEEILPEIARDRAADLVVVGEHGIHTGLSALLGGTAQRIVARAGLPVLVARALGDGPPHTVLAAVTDDEEAPGLLEWGSFLAQRLGATLLLLHVARRLGAPLVTGDTEDGDQARVDSWLESRARTCRTRGASVSTVLTEGDPVLEILRAASDRGVDLILVGRGGHGRFARSFMGSVSDAVLRNARQSVMVVPSASTRPT